jgi:hypothetical protein
MTWLNNPICWNGLKDSCVNVNQTTCDATSILEK